MPRKKQPPPPGRRKITRGKPVAQDAHWMARCLELARGGEGHTSPNPMVGCVIVSAKGEVVAEGFHKKLGGAHAEAAALALVGGRAPGCTMYINLEPCAHRGNRRTAPCAPLVRESGIKRLVIGMADPIRSHSGGAAWLKRHGIDVVRGVRRAECLELNRAFVTWAKQGRPLFVLKAGVTLDGKVATRSGESQWITGPAARRDVHRLRSRLDAILVGVETVRSDDPQLTVRGVRGASDPIRVVLDSRLRTPPTSALLPANSKSTARAIVAATARAPAARERRLVERGAEVWRLPATSNGRVNLTRLAARLAGEQITSVLVEGGGEVHASMLRSGLADEVQLYVAPMVFGGAGVAAGYGWIGGAGTARIAAARRLRFTGEPRRVGEDLVITARLR
jgi:diaminohydroxyphosphoribosylaminopyrimidine deaminase/5-amino-6-(5-phosphoribosylamino)uracil reductase